MCYPLWRAYNDFIAFLIEKQRDARLGLSVHVGITDLETDNPFTLSRLDTNDLPKQRNAMPNEWTLKAIGR